MLSMDQMKNKIAPTFGLGSFKRLLFTQSKQDVSHKNICVFNNSACLDFFDFRKLNIVF